METVISKNGIVHLMSPVGDGEYTFCGLEITEGGGDPLFHKNPNDDLSLKNANGKLPNCLECFNSVRECREALKGVKFSKNLRYS